MLKSGIICWCTIILCKSPQTSFAYENGTKLFTTQSNSNWLTLGYHSSSEKLQGRVLNLTSTQKQKVNLRVLYSGLTFCFFDCSLFFLASRRSLFSPFMSFVKVNFPTWIQSKSVEVNIPKAILIFNMVSKTNLDTNLLVWHVDLAQPALHWILGDIFHLQVGMVIVNNIAAKEKFSKNIGDKGY